MIKNLFLFSLALMLVQSGFGQGYLDNFGQLGEKDKALTSYVKDPDAEAVVIFDIGEASFFDTDKGYDIRFTRSRRIKILDQAGVDFAEVAIPIYVNGAGETEVVKSIVAYSYNNENGVWKRSILSPDAIFEERYIDRYRRVKFTLPNVKEGTIIEYKYVLETPFMFNLPDWEFQDRIPTLHSAYTVKLIPFYEYSFIAQGIGRFTSQNSRVDSQKRTWGTVAEQYGTNVGSGFEFSDVIHTYVMKDIPAFRDESYITSKNDYIMKIDFQLAGINYPNGSKRTIISTWEEMIEGFQKSENFGKYVKKSKGETSDFMKSHPDIAGKGADQKARALIEHVKYTYDWDGFYSKYAQKSPKEFHRQKSGNSAEINLYLLALLKAGGIDATPVLISTRGHGSIKTDYPYNHFFNHVLVLVGSGEEAYLADASNRIIPYNRIPPFCINGRGLIVEEGVKWYSLSSEGLSVESFHLDISPDPEAMNSLVKLKINSTEYEGYRYRSNYSDDTESIEKFLDSQGLSDIQGVQTMNYSETEKPYVIEASGEAELEFLENQLVIQPLLQFPISTNPFTQVKRSYPVDMIYANETNFSSTIQLPEGYGVHSVPEDFSTENALIKIEMITTQSENSVVINAFYTFKKAVYSSKEYALLKYYMKYIIEKFNEAVVLEKGAPAL